MHRKLPGVADSIWALPQTNPVVYSLPAMPKKKKRITTSGESTENLGSLGDMLKQAGFEASDPIDEPVENEIQKPDESDLSALGKLVVHKERKGRGGKTVTIIDGIDLDEASLKSMAKRMRKSLGCGSHIEDGRIVLQGDIVDRARMWLIENGARKSIALE